MDGRRIRGAALSGVVAIIIALIITYVVSLIIPTGNLTWSLIAVGFASFISAFAGYLSATS